MRISIEKQKLQLMEQIMGMTDAKQIAALSTLANSYSTAPQTNWPTTEELMAMAQAGNASIEAGKGISLEELEKFLDVEPTEEELTLYVRKG
jgi:hypothetical protein